MRMQRNAAPFRLPRFVARIGALLPQWPHSVALCTALNAAGAMKLLPDDQLDLLEGRSFVVEVLDTGSRAAFTCRRRMFHPLWRIAAPDLTFRAYTSGYLKLLNRQDDPDTLFFKRELSIEGDTELSLIVKNMLDTVELPKLPDVPGFLQRLTGRGRRQDQPEAPQ